MSLRVSKHVRCSFVFCKGGQKASKAQHGARARRSLLTWVFFCVLLVRRHGQAEYSVILLFRQSGCILRDPLQ